MALSLGLENLKQPESPKRDLTVSDFMDMMFAEEELQQAIDEYRESFENLKNFATVINTVKKYGPYKGFEALIADKKQLDTMLGCDICTETFASSEILRDDINHFLAKIDTILGRISDRFNNFIKTTLPFKEKYIRQMTDLKKNISNRKYDLEKFKQQSVRSALTKDKFSSIIQGNKKYFDALMSACRKASASNINQLLQAASEMPDVKERSSFATFYKQPWLSWFTKGKVGELGYSTVEDVKSVLDDVLKEMDSIVELNTWCSKLSEQYNRITTEISHLRAKREVDAAIERRKEASNALEFFFQIWESAIVYERVIRHEMYFATNLAKALNKCEASSNN